MENLRVFLTFYFVLSCLFFIVRFKNIIIRNITFLIYDAHRHAKTKTINKPIIFISIIPFPCFLIYYVSFKTKKKGAKLLF